jgi:hypothetical protein
MQALVEPQDPGGRTRIAKMGPNVARSGWGLRPSAVPGHGGRPNDGVRATVQPRIRVQRGAVRSRLQPTMRTGRTVRRGSRVSPVRAYGSPARARGVLPFANFVTLPVGELLSDHVDRAKRRRRASMGSPG